MPSIWINIAELLGLSTLSFGIGYLKIRSACHHSKIRPPALGHFYGLTLAFWTLLVGLVIIIVCHYKATHQLTLTYVLVMGAAITNIIGCLVLNVNFHARIHIEKITHIILLLSTIVAVVITLSIFIMLVTESLSFFRRVPITEFLLGTHWSPPTTLHDRPEAIIGHYGVLPLLSGTLLITIIALTIAIPLGLLIAIYTAEYASPLKRRIIKPIIEILAGVPTIIYGFFALIVVAPLLYQLGHWLHVRIASESALCAGVVMGIMIIPFISSLSDEALSSVPRSLRENAWALGATSAETILKVVIPAAFPGIASAVLLAFSRAIGETMLVVMAAGLTAHLTCNPLESVTTITVQIVSLLTGDQEFNSSKTLSAFALGLLLFLCTLILNIIALRIVRWHREKYG